MEGIGNLLTAFIENEKILQPVQYLVSVTDSLATLVGNGTSIVCHGHDEATSVG